MITALTAIGAVIFTGLSLNATQEQVALAQSQGALAEQGQVTDRYSKAIEQLGRQGSENLQIRLGGIYALERLAHDSARDQPTILKVLSAFVLTTTAKLNQDNPPLRFASCPNHRLTIDVQAALTVLGSRNPAHDQGTVVDLQEFCLSGADLRGANLSGANLHRVDLSGAYLDRADLSGADLRGANLSGTKLGSANLSGANLNRVDLRGADLASANLRDAKIGVADLSSTDLRGTFLTGADLTGTDLQDTVHDERTNVDHTLKDDTTLGAWW